MSDDSGEQLDVVVTSHLSDVGGGTGTSVSSCGADSPFSVVDAADAACAETAENASYAHIEYSNLVELAVSVAAKDTTGERVRDDGTEEGPCTSPITTGVTVTSTDTSSDFLNTLPLAGSVTSSNANASFDCSGFSTEESEDSIIISFNSSAQRVSAAFLRDLEPNQLTNREGAFSDNHDAREHSL
jgi:hypothetical protein